MPRPTRWFPAAFLVVAFLAGPGARAEDPPAEETPVPPDFLALLGELKDRLAEHEMPPPRTDRDHALHDAWSSILKPRAARMTARVRGLLKRSRWEFVVENGVERARRFLPKEWDGVVREMSMLYVELAGALEQYSRAKVTLTTPLGAPATPVPPYPQDPASTLAAIHSLEHDYWVRWRSGGVVVPLQLHGYWHLLGSLQAELIRREAAVARWKEAVQRVEDALARIEMGFQFQRDALALEMLAVRSVVAALQAAEEERLRALVDQRPPGSDERAAGEAILVEMASGRLEAEGLTEPPVSNYGSILRSRWLRPRGRL
jgi:hypothetical protein